MRQVKQTLSQTGLIAPASRAGLGDMPDRISADIAIGRRILRPADTDGIEHDE
jgi:hypothetical protein